MLCEETARPKRPARSDFSALTVGVFVLVSCASQPTIGARDAADANDTGSTLKAQTSTERALLQRLGNLPSGSPQQVGDAVVVAEAPYAAASGRTCRALQITSSNESHAQSRLACTNGISWLFVPDVFGSSSSSE
jgi:hypothetical protein